jgi:quercetin dioxygenase-like cupin family protein
MAGRFVTGARAKRDKLAWGEMGWMSRPDLTGTKNLTVIEVRLLPGQGHNFHKHPDQEEVIYVMEGEIEQWIEKERQNLKPGDSAFIPSDTVHASFTAGKSPAKLLAILGPCSGPEGYVLVDVSGQEPWKSLR